MEQTILEGKPSIFKNKNFIFLLLAAMFSSPGYYIYLIGSEWLMLTIDDNRFYFGMMFLAASIPRLLLLSVGGIVADRVSKRAIVFCSDIARALLIGLLLIFVWMDQVTAYHLIVLAAFFGMADAFSYPALSALTPSILPKEQLQKGNSFIQMTTQISPILGPALGGALIATVGFKGVFLVSSLMLVFSAVAVLFIRKEKVEQQEESSAWKDLKEGFSYMRKQPVIQSIIGLTLTINLLFVGPFTIGLPIMIKDVFAGDVINLSIVQTSMGLGALIGATTLAFITLKKPGHLLVAGIAIIGTLYMFTGLSIHVYMIAAIVAILGFVLQMVNIPVITLLQQTTEKQMIGRMMSFLMTASTGLVPVSYVGTSILIAAGVSIQSIMISCGIGIIVIAVLNSKSGTIELFNQPVMREEN